MYFLSATTSVAERAAEQTVNTGSLWNATNILVTILVGMITAIVTWKAAKANVNERSLSYSLKIYPILNNKFQSKDNSPWRNIKITYNDVILTNPCLVSVEIINTGNKGIENPPILISNNEEIEMIPLEVEEVPKGYIWKIEPENLGACKISASLINPKQKLQASFFMSRNPQKPLQFSCAMCDLQCHQISGTIDEKEVKPATVKAQYGVALGIFSALLLLVFQTGVMSIVSNLFAREYNVMPEFFEIYILSIPIIALVFCYIVPSKVNAFIIRHRMKSGVVAAILILIATFLLYLILNNIWIRGNDAQIIIAIITVLLYACSIHLCHYVKK